MLKAKAVAENKKIRAEKNAKMAVKGSNSAQKNNTTKNSSVNSQLRIITDMENIKNNFVEIVNMNPVAVLNGTEFKKSSIDLISQVVDYFNSIGGYVETEYGKVELTKSGVKASVAHGLGRNKAIAFKAVPNVLKNGKIIDYQTNWKNRGYDTAVFAAPVKIANKNYFLATIVLIEPNKNSYYLHEIVLQKIEENTVFKTGTVKDSAPSTVSSPINNLLRKIRNVNNSEQKNNTFDGDNDVKYSIRYTEDNKPVVVVEDDILNGVAKKDWVRTVKT